MSQGNIQALRGEEMLLQDTVSAVVEEYAQFYNLPVEVTKNADNIEILECSEEELIDRELVSRSEFVLKSYRASLQIPSPYTDEQVLSSLRDNISDEVARTKAYKVFTEGKFKILIKKGFKPEELETILKHEILHILASDSQGNSGFRYREGGINYHTGFNEGMTELLRLSAKMQNTDALSIYRTLKEGRESASYIPIIQNLCLLIYLTSQGEEPLTLSELAEIYFDNSDIPHKFSYLEERVMGGLETTEAKSSALKLFKRFSTLYVGGRKLHA